MPLRILFPGPGDPHLVVATILLSTVLIVPQLANASAGLV